MHLLGAALVTIVEGILATIAGIISILGVIRGSLLLWQLVRRIG